MELVGYTKEMDYWCGERLKKNGSSKLQTRQTTMSNWMLNSREVNGKIKARSIADDNDQHGRMHEGKGCLPLFKLLEDDKYLS